MIRYLLANLCLFLFISNSFCQNVEKYIKDSIDLKRVREIQIELPKNAKQRGNLKFPFSSIKVIDVRFDTTHVGLYSEFRNTFIPVIINSKINLKGGLSKSFSLHLNDFFKENLENNSDEVVCFLKKAKVIRRDTLAENTSMNKTIGQIEFQTEVFLKTSQGYHAVFKIDTVIIEQIAVTRREVAEEIKENMLIPALKSLRSKISNTDWQKVKAKKIFTESIVYSNYSDNRFSIPILTQLYKKGVYKSFSEFKNNNPSIPDFTIRKEKYNTVSLIDGNGDYINTINIFGFSDGKRCWIQRGNFCYPLIRTGNSFEFFYTIIQNLKILLSLDMDKGEVL